MKRACTVCGSTYEAQRVTARYCSTRCRTRASRAGTSKKAGDQVVTQLPTSSPANQPAQSHGTTYAATLSALETADRAQTPLGRAALILAERLDNSHRDTGSAVASVSREWRATLADALKGANAAKSAVEKHRDELAERRRRPA